MTSASASTAACEGSGLACASAVTPHVDARGRLWLAWMANGAVSVGRWDAARRTVGDAVVVDRVGVLAELYTVGDFAYVGGGFHAAGCLSMLPVVPPEIQAVMDMRVSIFAGEAEEGRFDEILQAAWAGTLKPLYNYMDDLPGIENAPTPRLPASALARNEGKKSSFDLGRGCPFQCSFCTIINVQGRKSRFRNADDLEDIIRENYRRGITSFFITDDNMATEWDR